ncbi:hypothetical protein [Roseateles depolymerans]|uniref:Uncharacterized protein n=1 Tax=Roseateles depolymerans TaxID=76731 RepID=A0A0U2UA42_9BURK|nr:hypothetical protein [Roseateles depolymerans]ALV08737.1 hypothetical protein RD2015_4293 [Roseateles depolymerans]REG21034.1 hypothetical protein DES44_0144 [Roseateles depolymerans]
MDKNWSTQVIAHVENGDFDGALSMIQHCASQPLLDELKAALARTGLDHGAGAARLLGAVLERQMALEARA